MGFDFSIFQEFIWGFWPGIVSVTLLGLCVGFLSSYLGLGGGFIYTPFFHSFFHLTAVQAVAVSLAQMPISSLSGLWVYYKSRKIQFRIGFLLLLTSIPSAQWSAYAFGRFEDTEFGKRLVMGMPFSELVYLLLFTVFLALLSFLNFRTGWKKRKSYYSVRPNVSEVENQPTSDYLPHFTKKSISLLLLVGIFFGMFSSLFGIGGGFLAVPFFIYFFRMSPVEAVATSFLGIFCTSLGTSILFFSQGKLHLSLAIVGSLGGVVGARLGSKKAIQSKPYVILFVTAFFQALVSIWYLFGKLREVSRF